jgi:citrate lyase subunit beta / citryl-CoA lyase
MVLFDLEDSVAPSAKEEARVLVVKALRSHRYEGKVRGVRVNGVDTSWCADDIRHVVEGAGERLDCLVIPKVEDAGTVHFAHHLLNQLEWKLDLGRSLGLELQIESARGLENVARIAAASPRNQALVFGPLDMAADLRLPGLGSGRLDDDPGPWHYLLVRVLVAARAHGLQAIDGPYVHVRDASGLRAAAGRSAALGYDGKWALTPAQAEVLNDVFAPSRQEFERAGAVVEAYRRATGEEARGALLLEGEMVDEASHKLALVTLERGRRAGMSLDS